MRLILISFTKKKNQTNKEGILLLPQPTFVQFVSHIKKHNKIIFTKIKKTKLFLWLKKIIKNWNKFLSKDKRKINYHIPLNIKLC